MSKPWNVQTMERTVDSGWWWCISVSSSTVINIPLCVGIDGGGDCRLQEISVPLAQFCYKPRTAQWHPTPVLLPGKSHGRRSLVGCSPWGREESDTTEQLHFSLFTFTHWRRKWQLTPIFLPRESQGWGSLVGCRVWGCRESDMTEATQQQQQL